MSVGLGTRERQILRLLKSDDGQAELGPLATAVFLKAKTLDYETERGGRLLAKFDGKVPDTPPAVYKSVCRAVLSLERKGLLVSQMHLDWIEMESRPGYETPLRFKQVALKPDLLRRYADYIKPLPAVGNT